MEAFPYLIDSNSQGRRLTPSQVGERAFPEKWMQELLRSHPGVLPVGEIEPVFTPLVSIGKEVPVDNGYVDNLFISPRGYPVLVETKLWRNPEARREVVAQAIDYAASLSRWTYDKLDETVRQYSRAYSGHEMTLFELVERETGPIEDGKDFFEEVVSKNLRLGRFLTLIVGDKIRRPLVDMLSYVNKYPGLAADVALVELQCFRLDDASDWPLVIVPRVVARTEIVERSVVQVTVIGAEAGVEVRQEKAEKDRPAGRSVGLTEEAFWELLRERAPARFDAAKRLVDELGRLEGVILAQNKSSISLKLRLPGAQISLFYLDDRALINVWPQTIADQLSRADYPPALVGPYEVRLREVMQAPKTGGRDLSRRVDEVDLEAFGETIRGFIMSIFAAEPTENES